MTTLETYGATKLTPDQQVACELLVANRGISIPAARYRKSVRILAEATGNKPQIVKNLVSDLKNVRDRGFGLKAALILL